MLGQFIRGALLIGLLAVNFGLSASNILITDIVKSEDANWAVTYRSKTPVQSIQFFHSPDDSRFQRWQLVTEGFSFRKLNGKDTVFKKDGGSFSSVTFALTPTYIHLPKSYAPFAPYSDGSMLLHSGRFFACATLCRGDENLWYLTLSAPASERIVFNGLSASEKVSWYDENDGRKVFVGNTEITETNLYLAVIDNALPPALTNALEEFIPKAMVSMASRFPAPGQKPMLFASFGETNGERYGRQGGVLPDQIFMHWYGKLTVSNPYDLIWFYAHEVTHLYQGSYVNSIENKDAWIHEGHAEFVAGELLMQFYPQATSFVEQKRLKAQQECKAKLAKLNLEEFSAHQEYQALYQCGMYFYQLLAEFSGSAEKISYDFWLGLGQKASDKGRVDKRVALAVAHLFLTEQDYQRLLREFRW